MRRTLKNPDSTILANDICYIEGNSANNKKIADILFAEQKAFCAYTDEPLTRSDAKDIEHFNPDIKGTPEDNYTNWFLVKHQWNKEKATKWQAYQPILHPTEPDLEQRVLYIEGDYVVGSDTDIEAANLIKLLKLDDMALADKRKKYIARRRRDMVEYGQDPDTYFSILLSEEPCAVSYLRAIKETFGIDIWEILP
jgi:hypothetical protein